jgi:hypothetical protein
MQNSRFCSKLANLALEFRNSRVSTRQLVSSAGSFFGGHRCYSFSETTAKNAAVNYSTGSGITKNLWKRIGTALL